MQNGNKEKESAVFVSSVSLSSLIHLLKGTVVSQLSAFLPVCIFFACLFVCTLSLTSV